MTHDYKRHGTTTLFAALSILDGQVISHCKSRHRGWSLQTPCHFESTADDGAVTA
jgi:hypothetical protein